ncbi:hypothetical protein Tco_1399020 [Tanacetum coccineum]
MTSHPKCYRPVLVVRFWGELEVEDEENAPFAATPPVGSPITLPLLSESSSDTEAAAPIVANGALEMPPAGSTYEVGGPSSVSLFPPFYLHGREIVRLDDNTELLLSNVKYLERCEKKRKAEIEANSSEIHKLEDQDQENTEEMKKMKKRLKTLETNYALVLSDRDEWRKAVYNLQAWVSKRFGRGAIDAHPGDGVDGSAAYGESQPPKPPGSPSSSQIIPPRRLKKKYVKRLVEKHVAKAIEEYKKTKANPGNASGSGSTNIGEMVNVQGCTHKTFMKGKPHPFNRTEGVVCLRRWIEKVEQVFEICKCAEEDKNRGRTLDLDKGDDIEAYNNRFHEQALMCPDLVPNEKKKIERYIKGFPERIKGNITSSRPTTLHDAINLARELVEQVVRGKAERVNESNKRKWGEHQKNNPNHNNPNNRNRNRNNNQHHQQNRRQETAKAYVAAPIEGKVYARTLPKCNRCNLHHNGQCPSKCQRCLKLGHQEIDCRVRLLGTGDNHLQNVAYYGYGEKGHLRNKFPKGMNQQNEGARARAYVVVENP